MHSTGVDTADSCTVARGHVRWTEDLIERRLSATHRGRSTAGRGPGTGGRRAQSKQSIICASSSWSSRQPASDPIASVQLLRRIGQLLAPPLPRPPPPLTSYPHHDQLEYMKEELEQWTPKQEDRRLKREGEKLFISDRKKRRTRRSRRRRRSTSASALLLRRCEVLLAELIGLQQEHPESLSRGTSAPTTSSGGEASPTPTTTTTTSAATKPHSRGALHAVACTWPCTSYRCIIQLRHA